MDARILFTLELDININTKEALDLIVLELEECLGKIKQYNTEGYGINKYSLDKTQIIDRNY